MLLTVSLPIAAAIARLLPVRQWLWSLILGGALLVLLSATVKPERWLDASGFPQPSLVVFWLLGLTLLLLTRRPAISLAISTLLVAGLAAVSLEKFRYTGVPLLWLDLHVAASTWPLLLRMQAESLWGLLAVLLALIALWRFDRPPEVRMRPRLWIGGYLTASFASVCALATTQFATAHDIQETGWSHVNVEPWAIFLGSITAVADLTLPKAAWDPRICCFSAAPEDLRANVVPSELPHLVVVLEESTFPPAELSVWREAPAEFFQAAQPLQAEVVGGGTWLTEYSVLHGVSPFVYGAAANFINLLGPGRLQGRLPVFLKTLGYSTTTLYPVLHYFYGARAFHHSLGMTEFIDCAEIPGCAGVASPQVHDQVFLAAAAHRLANSPAPAFLFLPTMRQHSPHAFGTTRIPACADLSEVQCGVLSAYAERLHASVTEFEDFLQQLQSLPREVVVLAFGDHIPADVNRFFSDRDFRNDKHRTFFTLWSSRRGYVTQSVMHRMGDPPFVHNAYADLLLARAAGFDSPYFAAKEAALRACRGRYCPGAPTPP